MSGIDHMIYTLQHPYLPKSLESIHCIALRNFWHFTFTQCGPTWCQDFCGPSEYTVSTIPSYLRRIANPEFLLSDCDDKFRTNLKLYSFLLVLNTSKYILTHILYSFANISKQNSALFLVCNSLFQGLTFCCPLRVFLNLDLVTALTITKCIHMCVCAQV